MVNHRGHVTTDVGALGSYVDSFVLILHSKDRKQRTRDMYADAALWFAGWLTDAGIRRWSDVTRHEVRGFFLHLGEIGYSKSYRNNIGRSLQAFFKFLAEEEELPNPFDKVKPPPAPKLGEKLVPVLPIEDMKRLIARAESGRDFVSRRDAALLRMFASTGCRLAEVTDLRVADISVRERVAVVTGKADKTRTVKFDHKCALALDRYLRRRGELVDDGVRALWIGSRRRTPMTPSGVRQMMERRGIELGVHIHPHLFRHTFSHNWLDAGGAEGDLMELNGWDSPQMLRHYGASAKAARARRAYDRIDVMGGV
jgi:site-specific recombinase XerD